MKKSKNKIATQKASTESIAATPTVEISWYWYTIPATILATLSWLFYYPSLHYSFQFDDVANITKYFHVRNNSFGALFFTGTRWISYWLNSLYYKVNKFDPFLYRIGNVTFHTITGLLVFFFFLYVLQRQKKESFFKTNAIYIAFFTAVLFLLHPVQTQTVSYVIQGQLEGLAALFIMAMALCFVCMTESKHYIQRLLLTLALFVLALLSCGTKEIAILSPLLLVIIDWFFVAQGEWHALRQRLWLHIFLCISVIGTYVLFLKPQFFTDILGFKIVAYNNVGNVITQDPAQIITPFIFCISQFKVILHYLSMFLWPFNISIEYDWMVVKGFFSFDCILPCIVLVMLAVLLMSILRKNSTSLLVFGFIWFFACILPRSSFIPSSELIADYKTYTASIGWLFLGAALGVYGIQKLLTWLKIYERVPSHYKGLPVFIVLGAFSLPIGFVTYQRNMVWRSGSEFWLNVIHNAPGKARAYNNYGVEISQNQQKYFEAILYFKKAIAMDAQYPDPRNNLAVAYSALGQVDEAIVVLQESIRQNPHYPEAYNNLASFLLQKKEYAHAQRILEKAIQLRPYYGKAYFNLGRLHFEQNNPTVAYNFFKKACMEADFDNDVGFTVYGQICAKLGRFDEAIFAFKKVLEFIPNSPESWLNLGNAYYVSKSYSQACTVYQEFTTRWPHVAQGWFNLGETYAALDDIEHAYGCYKRLETYKNAAPEISLKIAACLEKMSSKTQA